MYFSISTISPLCQKLHSQKKVVVLATGFFDLLHLEHRNFLLKAKAKGDILVVAVESDHRARQLKGSGRPFEPQTLRCQHLLELKNPDSLLPLIDYLISLPSDFDNFKAYETLMSAVRPDIYAVSSHTDHQQAKRLLTEQYGGRLIVVQEFNPIISTTKIIETGILSS